VKLNSLAFGAAIAVAQLSFAAQTPITQMEPVVVTATRFEDRAQQFPIGVEVIDQEQIRRSTAATVPELLSQRHGIRVRDLTGSPDMQVDLRGFGITGDQNTLVLVDGRRVSENELASVSWTAIPLSAIERIEVLRGSGTVLYGSGATAGTINIITKAPKPNERSLFVYGGVGSYGTHEERAGMNIAGKDVGLRLHGSNLTSAGFRDNNGLRQKNAQADLRHYHDGGHVSLKVGGEEQNLALPGSLSEAQMMANRRAAATPGDFADRHSGYADLGAEHATRFGQIAANLTYRDRETDAAFFVATPFRNNISTHVKTWSFTPRLKMTHGLGGWDSTLVTGVDVDESNLDRTASAFPARAAATQRDAAVYGQHTTVIPTGTSLSLGGRIQHAHYAVEDPGNSTSNFRRDPHLHAHEIALRQRLPAGASVYGRLGRSFRMPNVDDVFSLFTGLATPLEPQTSRDREVGFDFKAGPGRYHFAYYDIDLDNEIYFESITFTTRNLPPTHRRGFEAEASWRIGNFDLFANYTQTIAKFRSGQFGGVSIAGNAVPLVPRHSANVGGSWLFRANTRATVLARYVGEQRYDADEANTFARNIPSYYVVDTKVLHDRRDWQFAAGVRNLLNQKYYSYGIFTGFPSFAALPAPERAVFASAQYTFR
jgi:iron complex outermembrane receptor protein